MKSKEPLKAAGIGREDDRMDRNARWVGLETRRKGAGKELSRDVIWVRCHGWEGQSSDYLGLS